MVFALILFTFILNVSSGYIRLLFPKGSRARVRCLYIPITIAILQRFIFDLDYEYLPVFLATALVGLFLGGTIYRYHHKERVAEEMEKGSS